MTRNPVTSAIDSGPCIRLRVRTGLHAGACRPLARGRWLAGSQAECDLVLLDDGVAAQAAWLSVGDAGLQIEHIVDSNPHGLRECPSATESFRIGPVVLDWQPVPQSAPAAVRSATVPRSRARLASAGLAVTLLLCSALWLARLDTAAAQAASEIAPLSDEQSTLLARLQALTADLDGADLRVVPAADGAPIIQGWVRDDPQAQQVRQRLASLNVRLKLTTASEQIRYVREYLGGLGHAVQVRATGAGQLQVQAEVADEAAFRSAIARLQQSMPDLKPVELELQTVGPAVAAPPAKPGPPATPAPQLTGVDGISAVGRHRYLTLGAHYVFEGGITRGGAVVGGIEQALLELTK